MTSFARVATGATALAVLLTSGWSAAAESTRPIAEALDVASIRCLDRDSLAAQLTTWLRRDRIDSRLSIVVRPGPSDPAPSSVAFFVLRDGKAVVERLLPHVDVACDELRAAVGLAIAISVENTLVTDAEQPRPAPPETPPAAPSPEAPKPEQPHAARFSFGLRLMGAPGLLPRPAAAGSAELTFRIVAPLEANLGLLGTSPVTVPMGVGSADLRLVAGRLDACVARYEGWFGSRACAGVAGGRMIAEGSGYDVSYSPHVAWAAAMLKLEASAQVASGFRVAVGMDGIVPLLVPELEVHSPAGDVVASVRVPEFGATIFVGPQIDF